MSALGRFGRFTLFSPRVSHSNTCRLLSFVCFVLLFGFVALVCFCFLFCECLGIPNSPRSLDLDDRQGLIARSAMQPKKKKILRVFFLSLLPLCSLGSVGHSGPLSPLLPLYLFSLLLSLLFHHCLDSVGHSGPLGLWQPPLSSLLSALPLFVCFT